MNKVKINTGLAAIILLASMVAGWSTLLTVSALMLLFCEITDSIKQVMIKVITFMLAITLVETAWGLITGGVELITGSFDKIIGIINNYLSEPLDIYKLNSYLLEPVNSIVSILNNIVVYLIYFAEFTFVIAVLGNKAMKENIIVKKTNEFVDKAVSYINSFEVNINNVQQPVYATTQVAQQVPTQIVQSQNIQMPQQTVQPVNNNVSNQ